MAIKRVLEAFGFRGHADSGPFNPEDPLVKLVKMIDREHPDFPGLEKYPDALKYLYSIGVYPRQIAEIYPEFEQFEESEFDTGGHAFKYEDGDADRHRVDRVIFPAGDAYHFMMGVDRDQRYSPHRPNCGGYYSLSERRIRLNVLPDKSTSLQLQTATPKHLTNMASFIIDPQGDFRVTDFAMQNSRFLNTKSRYEERPRPRELSEVKNPQEANQIADYSLFYLESEWGLTENDIALPSTELTKKILMAPIESGLNLREMI